MGTPPSTAARRHPATTVTVRGIFVGRPRIVGEVRGRPVESGIAKRPVGAPELELDRTNLAGDRQADLSVHGGPDKAVYAYPTEAYEAWQADGFHVDVGGLGENVALAGLTEDEARIGDTWRWGRALVQISQPRAPCYKLSLHTGRSDIGPRMIATARSGWYLRVLEPGTVPTRGEMLLEDRDAGAPTVHETFTVTFDRDRPGPGSAAHDLARRVLATAPLAEQWRSALARRLDGGGA